ncbi:NAD(P)-binding domain-containing protein [Chryseobacterium sp. PBS4-4]|uniref:NAD(P)-binding domain-containing protein n=1 Tax=Chryseobacterium edaphi TaxID=2976532 RepID=A0ABT2W6A9_9FLAO|nr:NAD(P)-binding domain-containing protein [Chryseobacterium edaphi]MCU7617743.1 NAD(P)-binding domain-containing protein [Chryseobacterium edaphi]
MNIGFIGAGKVASKLGELLESAGHTVKYGVRNPVENKVSIIEATGFGEIVFLAIPYLAVEEFLENEKNLLQGKIIVDVTNPVNEDWSPIFLGEDSSGEQTARLLPKSRVVKAFSTVFAETMERDKINYKGLKMTVFIASSDDEAAEVVKSLAEEMGFDGLVLKGIENARYMDAISNINLGLALNGGGTDSGIIYFQRSKEIV